ncbi:amino acid ABC transporter substrate-binding protein [Nordella sp. HKS 07]|uniref:substrate-binding periplasmic protein n=1 Tax=Nordella sp. HKS 07 TaxID=2712222 RepID=UPI0013E0F3E4|nr:ABC transporter substrate-binding protein [Nordella sp. HKS 07]QIG46750.1 amino acid ABC transporter substrate-binding protein [Nordella sp. HKS 07]
MTTNPRKKSVTSKLLFLGVAVASAAFLAVLGAGMAQAEPKTLEAGKLTIGMNGDMPMTQLKDGVLSGTDGEIMTWVAGKIGLTPNVVQMDWAALIEATKQGKLDVMHGAMGWIEPRTKIMILSEPIYYFGTLLAQKDENNFTTFADMKGRKVGTVTGFTLVPELKAVEGIGEVKLYDTSDGVMQDLNAGRIDMAILDPPLVQYAIFQHPEWKLKQLPVTPEPDKYPIMSGKYNVIFGINKNEPELAEAINGAIMQVWKDCLNVKAMTKYGLGDKSWFIPPEKNPRIGVDREEGYKAPSADHCF